jgi:hypothetical protein
MAPEVSQSVFAESELAVTGQVVTAIVLDSNVVLKAGDDRDHEFRIENDFSLSTEDGDRIVHYDPYGSESGHASNLDELATIIGRRVHHATAYANGRARPELQRQPSALVASGTQSSIRGVDVHARELHLVLPSRWSSGHDLTGGPTARFGH